MDPSAVELTEMETPSEYLRLLLVEKRSCLPALPSLCAFVHCWLAVLFP